MNTKEVNFSQKYIQFVIVHRGVSSFLKLGGQVVRQHLLFRQNMGVITIAPLPPPPLFIDAPCTIKINENLRRRSWLEKVHLKAGSGLELQ